MTLANLFTTSRLFLAPLVFWLAATGRGFAATACFVLAACTDGFDGYLARSRGEVSNLGKLLDPVADKVLQTVTLFALVANGFAPLWLVLLLLGKEIVLLLGGLWMLRLGYVVSARLWGKVATVLLFVALGGGLANLTQLRPIMYAGAGISLLAGLDYLVQAVRTLTSRSIPG